MRPHSATRLIGRSEDCRSTSAFRPRRPGPKTTPSGSSARPLLSYGADVRFSRGCRCRGPTRCGTIRLSRSIDQLTYCDGNQSQNRRCWSGLGRHFTTSRVCCGHGKFIDVRLDRQNDSAARSSRRAGQSPHRGCKRTAGLFELHRCFGPARAGGDLDHRGMAEQGSARRVTHASGGPRCDLERATDDRGNVEGGRDGARRRVRPLGACPLTSASHRYR